MMLLPLDVFVQGVGLLLRSAQGVQSAAREGLRLSDGAPPARVPEEPPFEEVRVMNYESPVRQDRDLQDNMLKLVQYRILFVKREYEHVFGEAEEMVHDNMDGTAFVGWKIAEFMQKLRDNLIDVPKAWAAKRYPGAECVKNGKLVDLPADDKKYLRVYFEVQERYAREKFRFEETQVDVLREIAQRLQRKS